MKTALIGHSGFVGSTLLRQAEFSNLYRSSNIHDISNSDFDLVVCAGAPAQKWIANREPENDLQKINLLIDKISTIRCEKFILISTVDVFQDPVNVTELSATSDTDLHPYGLHRRLLEKATDSLFSDSLIVRLPGLVGPGLRKNIIFDLHNDNDLHLIDSRNRYQFYPMVNLWYDIQTAISAGLSLVHLTAQPVTAEQIARDCFGVMLNQSLESPPANYDLKTIHGAVFGKTGPYQYSLDETVLGVRAYKQSEPKAAKRKASVTH